MNKEDPFDNCGLDFGSVRAYLSSPRTHVSNNDYEHSISLGGDGHAPELHGNADLSPTSESSKNNRIIFVAGYPTPEQVARLTKDYNISPEVWRRHLATSDRAIEDTKLPSASCNIFQLRFWTIASWVNTFDRHQVTVQSLREHAAAGLKKYLETLMTLDSWRAGDSVVRDYEIHDRVYFSLEQVVTMYTRVERGSGSDGNGETWLALICSDCGRDLAQSPGGPWLGERLNEAGFHVRTFPVPEHCIWSSSDNAAPEKENNNLTFKTLLGEIPQSLATLSKEYKSGRDIGTIDSNPMSALHRVFSFFVSSEAYSLSFMACQIKQHSSHDKGNANVTDTEALSNLLHCQQLLERHIEELRYALRVVRDWRSNDHSSNAFLTTLDQDLLYLIERAFTLKNRAETSISLSMNIASIDEARRSVQQNSSVFRFTVIASIYVPLSFVATVFGMNFRQFGQGDLSIWIYFVVSIPVFIVSASVLFVNPQALFASLHWIKSKCM